MDGWRGLALVVLACGIAACGSSSDSPPPTAAASTPPPPSNAAPVAASDEYRAHADVMLSVAAPGLLANDSDSNGDSLSARLVGGPANGTLTLQPDGSFDYAPAAGFTGTDEFRYAARDGTRESAAATVTIDVGEIPLLFSESFGRATSASVGNGWIEAEAADDHVVLDGTRLYFAAPAEGAAQPLAAHRFSAVTAGFLEWEFELDWAKTGTDDAYVVHMQLGDGEQMRADSLTAGVGVDLVWGRIGGTDQTFGYNASGATTALAPLSGRAAIRVLVDVGASTYDVYVDGQGVGSQVPIDVPTRFDTMRFVTNGVNGSAFSGRTFDAITVDAWHSDGATRNWAPIVPDRRVWVDDTLATEIVLSYTDGDGPGPHTFHVVDGPTHGTLDSDDGDATVVYNPAPGYIGTDGFTYRVNDGDADSSVATVAIVVQHYPGAVWETKLPDEVGLRADVLDQLAARIGGVGAVVRDGYMVHAWGDQNEKADWASSAKPVLHTLLFFAIHEGLVPSVHEPVQAWVLQATGGTLLPEDEPMTFSHLMNMTSGYAVAEPPGVAWAYNDYASNLKNRLIGAILGEPLDVPLFARLAPLQFQDGSMFTTRGGYGIATTARDFARIGWFWMNHGHWRNEQILPGAYFDEYMRTQVPESMPHSAGPGIDYLNVGTVGGPADQTPYGPGVFGASWWFNERVGPQRLRAWPAAPLDMFQANGHWSQEIVVMIPSLNLLVLARGSWGSFAPGDPNSGMNETLGILMSAVVP